MTRWMHPPELERQRDRDQFDPVVEGDRYGLSRDVSLAIWERVCADATDGFGRRDTKQAEQRFHEIAARIAARGGRLRPDVGRLTRVAIESDGTPRGAWSIPELAPRIPGRETLVAVEARRWKAMGAEPAAVLEETEAAAGSERDGGATERHELPHANDVAQALTSLLRPPSSSDPANASDLSERAAARRRLDIDLAAWSPPGREIDREPRDGQLPAATLARMEQAYGQRFDDVEIHADSAEVSAGQQAFTRGRHIYFERGAFEPESDHGEHVIAHELAHVAQQSQPAGDGRRPASRVALEADADQAALSALAGRAAIVNLFAPPSAALGFSNGKPPQHPASAHGSAGRPPAQSARGSTPASSSGATHAPAGGRAPTSAGSGGASARSGATPAARPAASYAAASTPPAAAPHRGANADGLLVPEAPSTLTPGAAARLQTIHTNNQGVATATTTLPSGEQQTSVARDAVVEPQAEQDAHAQHGVVAAVDDRPPPSPEIEAACARIRQVIRDKRPPDEDKLVDAKPREMAQEAGNQMSAGVEQRAGTVRQGYADMQNSPQGTPSRTPVPATLPPERVSTPPVDAAAGAPDPLHHDDVSLDNDVSAQKQRIQDAGMNTEPAKLVKDGPIGDAHSGADDLQEMAKTDPQKVIADQAAAIAKAKGDMRALQESGEKALADARAGAVSQMATHTTGVKSSEEQQRAQAGEQMKAVFTRTQKSVDTLLQPLSADAVARWDAGVAQLSTDFEASLADVKRRIDERHSGVGGMFAAGWDWATGLPDWVTEGYDRAEAKFGDGATNLIRDISRDVNKVIEDCKKLIELARKEIEAIVKSLPASLQTWAQGEAAKLNQQLDALDKRVDQTQKGINQDLINHANGAVQQVRERVHDLREKAKGALAKIAAAIVEFAKNPAKAIVDGLLHILGIPPDSFWSMIDRLGDVVGAIAKDPVKFGKTLISGAAQGFKQFFEHFPTHLKEILMGWLFGTMGTAGVPMPTDFSGPGIMVTVLGIVGIDTGMISSMLGADVSDPAEMAEVHQELAGVLSGDPHALVNLFREHFDPASLIPMIKEAAMSFLLQALIMQVAPRIAAMLVPGGAILQAVEAIFKVLMWVINNAARIFTLIESLVATAGQAVAGNVSGVAAGVESGLVQIIVLVIDFLASYLGLGGLGAKLKGVIMKLSGKLKGVLKKVLDAIKKRAKAKAKTKHDQHKPADKKPDGDHAGPTHPKQDDRDPQKAKDDAKDPRNHQRDPDDAKDPRNHKSDPDDKDPRNHQSDPEDKDPRNHHKDDDDKAPTKHHDEHDGSGGKPKHHEEHSDKDEQGSGPGKKKAKDDGKSKDEKKKEEIQKRVEQAERELPPKILGLLSKHPSKLRVRTQFAIWKLTYKLRRLEMVKGGSGVDHIEAQVNPKINLGTADKAYEFEWSEIAPIFHRVASKYVGPAIHQVDEQGAMQYQLRGQGTDASLEQQGKYITGAHDDGSPAGFEVHEKEKGFPFTHKNNVAEVRPVGGDTGASYPKVMRSLAGVDSQALGRYLKAKMRNEPNLPPLGGYETSADELFGIWSFEPGHPRTRIKTPNGVPNEYIPEFGHQRDWTYSMMTADLLEGGHLSMQDAILGHPAQGGGAQAGAALVTAVDVHHTQREPTGNDPALPRDRWVKKKEEDKANYNKRVKKEIALVEAWVRAKSTGPEAELWATKPTPPQIEAWVVAQIQAFRGY